MKVREGDLSESAYACMSAAWACDDRGEAVAGRRCRRMAARSLKWANSESMVLFDRQPGVDGVVIVDLLRRAGRFSEAMRECRKYLRRTDSEDISLLLRFEKKLIRRLNTMANGVGRFDGIRDAIRRAR